MLFDINCRLYIANANETSVLLEVQRLQGMETNVSLDYATVEPSNNLVQMAGMSVHKADPDQDYQHTAGMLNFPPNEVRIVFKALGIKEAIDRHFCVKSYF